MLSELAQGTHPIQNQWSRSCSIHQSSSGPRSSLSMLLTTYLRVVQYVRDNVHRHRLESSRTRHTSQAESTNHQHLARLDILNSVFCRLPHFTLLWWLRGHTICPNHSQHANSRRRVAGGSGEGPRPCKLRDQHVDTWRGTLAVVDVICRGAVSEGIGYL